MNGFEHLYMWVFFGMASIIIGLVIGYEVLAKIFKNYFLDNNKDNNTNKEDEYDDY